MRVLWLLTVALGLSACQSAQVVPPEGLGAAHRVQGIQGWMPGRQLRFAEFHTQGKVSGLGVRTRSQGASVQGWAELAHRQVQASQKRLAFTLVQGDSGRQVLVSASGSLQGSETAWQLPTPLGALRLSQAQARQRFLGTLLPSQGSEPLSAWRFELMSPEGDGGRGTATLGWAHRDGDAPDAALLLLPLRQLRSADGRYAIEAGAGTEPLGFEIQRDGRALAALSKLNGGQVWFAENLDPDLRLACAGLMAALLLRRELTESL